MSFSNKYLALFFAACLLPLGGLSAQGVSPLYEGTISAAFAERTANDLGASVIGVQLAERPVERRGKKKDRLKTVTNKKQCGIELKKRLIDLPTVSERVRNLAAIKAVMLRKVRGRKRWVLVVSLTAAAVRRDLKRRFARANGNPAGQITAIDIYIKAYETEIESLKKHGFVDKPVKRVGVPPKSMQDSLDRLRAWRKDIQGSMPGPSKKQAQNKACPPNKSVPKHSAASSGFSGNWLVNANGYLFTMDIKATSNGVFTSSFVGKTQRDPYTSRISGAVVKTTIRFSRFNNLTGHEKDWKTQKYSGRLTQTRNGRRLNGTFMHKRRPYTWCAITPLPPQRDWSKLTCPAK